MPSLQIRELPADVYEALSYRAERAGRSLAQQAIVELRRAQQVDRQEHRDEILGRLAERIDREGTFEPERSPEDLVRADRRR